MKGILVEQLEEGPLLKWTNVADVTLRPNYVIVDIHATAVNRADLAQARGAYPPPPGESNILGLEMAGVVAETGDHGSKWNPGDRVFALLGGGGYAEKAAVHEDMLLVVPEGWSLHRAAAIPEAWLTAYVNLFWEGTLDEGEVVMIHAAASGVGSAAIQLAKAKNATVIATASSQQKLDACLELGADYAVSYKDPDFFSSILELTAGRGVDLILDPVGGSYLEGNIRLLKPFGRLILIGLLGGTSGQLDLSKMLKYRLKIIGSRLRNRSLEEKIRLSHSFWESFGSLFQTDALRPIIDTVIPIEQAQAAHEYVKQNKNIGKVVLAVRD